ncbi:MAG: hypothetical protein JXB13_01700 [Phycisphaerae bacterium]|nr:hypothetical protein [Phycisphaerae bacterium]
MSNLRVPTVTLAALRAQFPLAWEAVQGQIRSILNKPLPPVESLIAECGREAAHEGIEVLVDAGRLRFVHHPENPQYFCLAVYLPEIDDYLLMTPDGALHRPDEVVFEIPEEDEGDD